VVGGNLPLAVGSALAARLQGSDRVTVVFFGDGAVQAGHFNESVNLAALWELPLILVCENNGMAEFTARSEHSKVELVCDVVAPYGFERQTVDGGDVPALWSAFGGYLQTARRGRGPLLLECLTHRRRGHYEGDAQSYREALAQADWEALDPLARLQVQAIERKWLDETATKALEQAAQAEVEAAVAFARASPFPEPAVAAEMVYAAAEGQP
jgi:pyruvate dehydrogenase E1 component alpha subunit